MSFKVELVVTCTSDDCGSFVAGEPFAVFGNRLPVVTTAGRVEIGGVELGRVLLDSICVLYDEVFSVPPFFWREDESELHRQRLLGLLACSGDNVRPSALGRFRGLTISAVMTDSVHLAESMSGEAPSSGDQPERCSGQNAPGV